MQPNAFDNEKYLVEQSQAILERINQVGGKLYLEFGGKLLFDYHASRVLPGFDPNVKMRLLQKLKDRADWDAGNGCSPREMAATGTTG